MPRLRLQRCGPGAMQRRHRRWLVPGKGVIGARWAAASPGAQAAVAPLGGVGGGHAGDPRLRATSGGGGAGASRIGRVHKGAEQAEAVNATPADGAPQARCRSPPQGPRLGSSRMIVMKADNVAANPAIPATAAGGGARLAS